MERTPTAAEMERYKQEMLEMYQRARPAPQEEPAPPPIPAMPDRPLPSAPPPPEPVPQADDQPTAEGTGSPAAQEPEAPRDSSLTEFPFVDDPLPEEYLGQFPDTGYIRTKISSSNQALPIRDAAVILSKAWEEKNHILHRETSDESGLIPNLPLPAPGSDSSMTPDDQGRPRFAIYDMIVTKDGYVPVVYRSVPVFSGVVTVQPVQLIPQAAAPEGQRLVEFEAPSPDIL